MPIKQLNILGFALSVACLIAPLQVGAGEIQPFTSASMQKIVAPRQGKPFILGLWSLSCTHCREDLALLSRLAARYPKADLVLIAADSAEESAEAASTLDKLDLHRAERWIFADPFTERLRFSIDRTWRGELPRTYFYEANHRAKIVSGKLNETETEAWLKQHVGP
jgi:thiol-disulfide isomerase/thioredoxin